MPVRPSIHTIKVSLRYMKPPVWRRLQVPSTTSLAQLHHIIQAAMGWYDCHLHQFEVRDLYYAAAEHELDDTSDESRRTLVNLQVGERFVYCTTSATTGITTFWWSPSTRPTRR